MHNQSNKVTSYILNQICNVAIAINTVVLLQPQPNDNRPTPLGFLNELLQKISPNSNSSIIVGGDFNLGNIDWDTSSTLPGNSNIGHGNNS